MTNAGPSAATATELVDELPVGMHFISASTPRGTCAAHDRTVTCALGTLAVPDAVSVTVTAKADFAAASSTVLNTATVSAAENDNDPSDNTSTHPVTVGPAADLSLVKSAPARVHALGQLLDTLQVGNAGGQTATNVNVTDELPAGLTFVSAQATQGQCAATGQTVTCAVGSLPTGGSAQVLIAATVSGDQVGRSIPAPATSWRT